jgi:xanthine dehydrogenase molybdenum-binding subunit
MTGQEREKIVEQLDNRRKDKYLPEQYRNIGKRGVRKIDGYEKASGKAAYTMDVHLPGMIYLRFLTSPYPHAEIKSMDTRDAAALPGVRMILRYDDPELPETVDVGGHEPSSEPPIPHIAHFQGEEAGAAVAADSEEIAEQALKLIKVEWIQRPFVLDEEEALKNDAPVANPEVDAYSNRYGEKHAIEKIGDVDKGFSEADRITEFKFRQGLNTWIGPEAPCGVFAWNGEYPEIWVKTQRPHVAKRAVASWFGGIPMNRIQVHCLYQGASFGGFSQMSWNLGGQYCAAVVARRTGRPVKWTFSRREDFYGGEMDLGTYYYKVGYKNDGTITAVKARAIMANQTLPVFGIVKHIIDNTRIPNVYGELIAVRVNKGPTVPVRCEQNANCHSMTLVFNHVAADLGMDPAEIALKNDGAEGHDLNWLTERKIEMGFTPRDSLRECIEKGKKAVEWDRKWHLPGGRRLPNGRMHGLGFCWSHEWDDSGGSSEIAIHLERNDGTACIYGCRCDNGVNAETAYCQIAADELGMKIEDVYYRPHHDTGFYPMTPDTSTNMSVNGYAVRNAARLLKRKVLEAAVSPTGQTQLGIFPPAFPGKTPEELDIEESIIFEKANPANRIALAEFVGPSGANGPLTAMKGEPVKNPDTPPGFPYREPFFEYSWQMQTGTYAGIRLRLCRQAHFMEVEVDTETGEIDIVRVVNVNDVGKVVSWDGCEGQQYGGTCMGVGRGRTEEVIYDKSTGVMLNGNLLNYKIPTMLDIGPIDTLLVETGQGYGPYGLVGIGEDVATIVPTLIIPAVHNAIGIWVEDLPMTPDKVLKALGKA